MKPRKTETCKNGASHCSELILAKALLIAKAEKVRSLQTLGYKLIMIGSNQHVNLEH